MFDVGRVCVKLAGRDAGKKCVVVDVLDFPYVLVDGETRRRKTNIRHLLPTEETLDVKKAASHEAVVEICSKTMKPRFTKPKKAAPRPKKVRVTRPKTPKKKVVKPAETKKETPKAEKPKTETPLTPKADKPTVEEPKTTPKKEVKTEAEVNKTTKTENKE